MSVRIEAPPMVRRRDAVPRHGAPQPWWRHPSTRRVARLAGVVGGTLAVLAILAFTVFPTRTWLNQRAATADARENLEVLRAENRELEARIDALQTDAEIERLAREQHNLVRPGEEAYAVLPAPPAEIDLPAIWPYGELLEPPAPLGSGNAASVPRDE